MIIIGINGRAGSGKSTFKDYVIQSYTELTSKSDHIVIPFAKALKDLAVSLGWNGEKDEKGRKLLQLLGTDVCRKCLSENYWLQKWGDAYIQALICEKAFIVVDDVRFMNEAQYLKGLGAKLIKITGRCASDVDTSHCSEAVLTDDLFDKVIINNTTLKYLQVEARSLVKGLLNWTY